MQEGLGLSVLICQRETKKEGLRCERNLTQLFSFLNYLHSKEIFWVADFALLQDFVLGDGSQPAPTICSKEVREKLGFISIFFFAGRRGMNM